MSKFDLDLIHLAIQNITKVRMIIEMIAATNIGTTIITINMRKLYFIGGNSDTVGLGSTKDVELDAV